MCNIANSENHSLFQKYFPMFSNNLINNIQVLHVCINYMCRNQQFHLSNHLLIAGSGREQVVFELKENLEYN